MRACATIARSCSTSCHNLTAPLVYLAAPLFSQAERDFNLALTERIEGLGYRVFLPQRDGPDRDKPGYLEMPPDERRALIFTTDRDMVYACNVLVFVLDGRVPDEGACVELGLAYAHREFTRRTRKLLGLQTDIRAAFIGGKLNPMLRVALDEVVGSVGELLALLEREV